ncbi:MAG TPA: hypothetical protein VLH41_02805 [Thermoanaerobaculia bacterium]|nr:hypothetical protein [Thermoanaerobaculia bacterium]
MGPSAAASEFLETVGLSAQLPTPRFLEDLFLRVSAALPYETLTRGRGGRPGDVDAETLLARAAEGSLPLVGGERTHLLLGLARGLGFDVRPVAARTRRGRHVALGVRFPGHDVLADPAWPLPVLVPLDPPACEIPTPYGALSVRSDGNELVVVADGRGREREVLRLEALPVPEAEARALGTAPADLSSPFALRLLPDRTHFWRQGRMTVADAWSRLTWPLGGAERRALKVLFAIETDLPDALSPEAKEPPTLTVWHASLAEPERLKARLSVAAPFDGEGLVTGVRYGVEPLESGARLSIHATLKGGVPPGGLPETARKTLVFRLASELFLASREA